MKGILILSHLTVAVWTIVCIVYFVRLATLVPRSDWTTFLPQSFIKIVPSDTGCDTSYPPTTLYAPLEKTTSFHGGCQLDFDAFVTLTFHMGLLLPSPYTRALFDALDVTGNGQLSWGEITRDIFGDSRFAVEVYVNGYQASLNSVSQNGIPLSGFGLTRLKAINQILY